MRHTEKVFGRLSCRIVDTLPVGQSPELIVVLCHGFGAPGTDLVPLGAQLFHANPRLGESIRFLFPSGPLSLDEYGGMDGRAWWMIDMSRLTCAMERGELTDLRNDFPAGLPEARSRLLGLIDEVRSETGLPLSRFVLGGFSQGAMLATDVALRLPEAPAALCIWSGTLLCESAWKPLAPKRKGLRVLQSHGRQDPLLPFEAAGWLRDLLTDSGLDVEFMEFQGVHQIALAALQRFAALLDELTTR